MHYVAKDGLATTDTGFVLDHQEGESFTVNETGLVVVNALLSGVDSREIWREIAAVFEVTDKQASRDVDRFLERLRTLDMVEEKADDDG